MKYEGTEAALFLVKNGDTPELPLQGPDDAYSWVEHSQFAPKCARPREHSRGAYYSHASKSLVLEHDYEPNSTGLAIGAAGL